jgi:hypothetical protein
MATPITDAQLAQLQQLTQKLQTDQAADDEAQTAFSSAQATLATTQASVATAQVNLTNANAAVSADVLALQTFVDGLASGLPQAATAGS